MVDEGIFQRDGRIWTSAGVTAEIDLMLALVEEDLERRRGGGGAPPPALPPPNGGQAQFSEALRRQDDETPRGRDVAAFVADHLDEPLPVERLARRVGMSVRSLTRWFQKHHSLSPAKFVRRVRVEEARRLLADTNLTLLAICERTGLGDASTFHRVFREDSGLSPAAYRNRSGRASA